MATQRSDWRQIKLDGWRSTTARLVTGVLSFLAISGLAILLLPFSTFTQHSVVVHTAIGLLWMLPFLVYTVKHVRDYWTFPLTHIKFTGYVAGVMTLICAVSGLVLTWEGVFATRITYAWRTVHIVTTFGTVFFLAPHLVLLFLREKHRVSDPGSQEAVVLGRRHGAIAAALLVAGLVGTGALSAAIRPASFVNEFPADYEMDPYGKGPFAPSLASTLDGGAQDARSLSGSESCGTSGCHEQIYQEWLPSAHRYASMDAGFQAIQGVMAAQNGAVSTRYCAGCHDPISLFSGTKFIGVEDLTSLHGYKEGISCLACHAIQETDVKGNAHYRITQPDRYVYELREGAAAKFLGDFLIRTYPRKHVETLSRRMFKTPEFCAACHKQFIDQDVNKVGWVQLQNQFDNWKASRWNEPGHPETTLECRECHMPLHDSADPAAGDEADFNRDAGDGKHRSHRFLGANQFLPLVHQLEGAEEHCEMTQEWMRGELAVPEIAGRWREGPVVPIELDAPREVVAGQSIPLRVHLVNNKAGHDFPTGPLDIIQAWVEVEVVDEAGNTIFHSGNIDDENFIETGTFMFKAEPVDRYGNLIDRHNLWEMVGVRFKRSLFPGAADTASYDFLCPGSGSESMSERNADERLDLKVPTTATGRLTVTARLNYRKFDQYLLNFAFGKDSGLKAPVTVLSSASTEIAVVGSE